MIPIHNHGIVPQLCVAAKTRPIASPSDMIRVLADFSRVSANGNVCLIRNGCIACGHCFNSLEFGDAEYPTDCPWCEPNTADVLVTFPVAETVAA